MEPYRAFVSDRLAPAQHSLGFLTQSAFTGLGQTLSYLTPALLVLLGMSVDATNARGIPTITMVAFVLGSVFSIASILWTVRTTPELPLPPDEIARIRALPTGIRATLSEVAIAIREMPVTMRQLGIMMFFQWYAMFCYWQYIVLSLAMTMFGTRDPASHGFREANLLNGQIGGFYNAIAFVAAFAMVPFTRRLGAKTVHAAALTLAGIGMLAIPAIDQTRRLFVPMLGVGLAWASMMGNPYVMLAGCVPRERVGVYMGIFNMFIVIPMMIQIFTLPLYYDRWLGGSPANVIRLAGGLLICGAVAVMTVRPPRLTSGAGTSHDP